MCIRDRYMGLSPKNTEKDSLLQNNKFDFEDTERKAESVKDEVELAKEGVRLEDVALDVKKDGATGQKVIELVEKKDETPGAGANEGEGGLKLSVFLHFMYLKEKAKPAVKNLKKASTLAVMNTVSKFGKLASKGKLYFILLHHQLGSIFVSDTVFNTRKERLTVYISTLMSQFFTSTTFYNTEFDKKNNPDAKPMGKECESADCVLFESITGMGIIDIAFIVVNNLLTLPLVLGCSLFFVRKYVIRDKEEKTNVGAFRKTMKKIKIKITLGYIVLYLYCIFCIWMVVQFSANQTDDMNVGRWLMTFSFSGLSDVLIKQPLVALVKYFGFTFLNRKLSSTKSQDINFPLYMFDNQVYVTFIFIVYCQLYRFLSL
eukprot:TRINITY_DN5068_c0_g1_i7.p1 TRINITY_DN5068_c0_g1~~TRINITY_DN5068_c0_g1_i7.p1  ORF type:complete len:374 (+),score=70.96 TRINITY_DN5068_c0_g1_i7:65-1186(+)